MQSQDRVNGNFKKSIHRYLFFSKNDELILTIKFFRYELPGGYIHGTNEPNIISQHFTINQQNFGRYSSTRQVSYKTGQFQKLYNDSIKNLCSMHSTEVSDKKTKRCSFLFFYF